MTHETFANRWNLDAIEDAYQRWQTDANSVDERWQSFFAGFELATRSTSFSESAAQTGVVRLAFAYRDLGHFLAYVDPLTQPPAAIPLLALDQFGLTDADLDRTFDLSFFFGMQKGTLRELIAALKETYCRTIGVEFMHIQDTNIRHWLREKMEPRRNRPNMQRRQQLRVLMNLHFAELFEKFLHTRYVGQKRFSLEGAETLIPLMDAFVEKGPELGVSEFVIGMAHRGRLNVLANILRKPYQEIFAEFEDNFLPDSIDGDGDVKYHLGFSSDVVTEGSGQKLHLSLAPNPSHLEAVDPVVEGRTRAKQRLFGDTERKRGIPVLIHGDAAFAGQGIVAEVFNLANLAGYRTGGTLHIIINNQIGFTTSPGDARSTTYCTDVAKMIQAPIFHVNAEDPEACVYIAELALEFRQTFRRDVVIDLNCYRRHGHNEGDEPTFTQPMMYSKIKDRPSASTIYTRSLIETGVLSEDEAKAIDAEFQGKLQNAQVEVRSSPPRTRGMRSFTGAWSDLQSHYSFTPAVTGVPKTTLIEVLDQLTNMPATFHIHPKAQKLLDDRRAAFTANKGVDWSFAEALAFGSLVKEGTPVRLSGQDSRRGTFSQRHAVFYDVTNGERYVPLNSFGPNQAPFDVYDSLLSETAVLGFEFGYSMDDPTSLVLWEAQFGDFANGAQTIIDQFIVCSESKWQRGSGLVMLLPHGYEGQGPEHSSARLERFLQACAEDNIQVCNLTTPAQYFHALRRQMRRNFRKPLIIMTPKSLLRHKEAVSTVDELVSGVFREVIDDPIADPKSVRRIVMSSGKVYYDLLERRGDRKDVALVRVEQFYPFPEHLLRQMFHRFTEATEVVWVQEESQNMGGWSFMEPRLRAMGYEAHYVGRDASASPATGSKTVHDREQKELVVAAVSGNVPHLVRSNSSSPTPRPKEKEPTTSPERVEPVLSGKK